jgi:hypothetical protein
MKNLITGMLLLFIAQVLVFFQVNGQFIWPWFKRNPILLSIGFGTLISYLLIHGTGYMVAHFNGTLWENRLLGFGVGMISFALLTYIFMGEGINLKTSISLLLALILVLIQIFWKV